MAKAKKKTVKKKKTIKLEGPRNGNGRSNPQFFERGRLYDVKQRAKKGITKWRRK